MKILKNCLILLLSSCVQKPSVTTFARNDGFVVTRYNVGTVVMAREGATVTEVRGPGGIVVKHMSESIDATEVPISAITANAAKVLGGINADVAKHAETQNTERVLGLGAQSVEKEGIKAGISGATEFNPNIPLPIRK